MTDVYTALYTFFSGIGNAYVEGNVPDSAVLPYLTYEISIPKWNDKTLIGVNCYSRSSGFSEVTTLAQSVLDAVGTGVRLDLGSNSYIILYKGSPLLQEIVEEDFMIKHLYIILQMHCLRS